MRLPVLRSIGRHLPRRLPVLLLLLVFAGAASAAAPAPAESVTNVRIASLPRATQANRVVVDRVGINLPIRNGVIGKPIRERIAYRYPGTSWPGGKANTYLYAHARKGSFLRLKDMRKGDIVRLRLVTGGWVRYKVTLVKRVKWNDGRWTLRGNKEQLTLQTCTGNTRTADRIVVVAVPAY